MSPKEVRARDRPTGSSNLSSEVQSSLLENLPDLLFLLADTREQLAQMRTETVQASLQASRDDQAVTQLREVVASLQGELEVAAEARRTLESELSEALGRIDAGNEDQRRLQETVRLIEVRATTAEAQLQEIRASRSWRVADPLRRAGSFVRRIRNP
jgi:chromosome segregation ATPase